MLRKFAFTAVLASLWMLGGVDTAEAGGVHGGHHVQKAQGEIESLSYDITPTAAFVGAAPASAFPVCHPPVFHAAPVILFLLQPSASGEPALIVGEARCARMTRHGVMKTQLVPLFFVVFPETERQNVNFERMKDIERYVPRGEPPPSQFVPGRMDAGHSIG